MRHEKKTVLIGVLVSAVALSLLISPAAAQFVHPRGILLAMYPQEIVVFYGAPGNYERVVAVIIKPPGYFVDDFTGFDSLTLTFTLSAKCYQCSNYGKQPLLLGGDDYGRWVTNLGPVSFQDEYSGAFILVPITFVVPSNAGRGFFMLFLSAQATGSGLTFNGWDQVGVAVAPSGPLG